MVPRPTVADDAQRLTMKYNAMKAKYAQNLAISKILEEPIDKNQPRSVSAPE